MPTQAPAKPALPFLTQCSLGPPHSKFRPDADFDVLLRKPAGQALYRELAECTFPRSVWHEKTKQLLWLLPSRMQGRYVGTDPAEFIGKVLTHGAVLKQRELAAALHHDAWRVPHINDWSYSEPAHYGGTASISAGDLKAVAQLSLHFELPKNAEVFRYSTACRLVRHPGQASALSVAEGLLELTRTMKVGTTHLFPHYWSMAASHTPLQRSRQNYEHYPHLGTVDRVLAYLVDLLPPSMKTAELLFTGWEVRNLGRGDKSIQMGASVRMGINAYVEGLSYAYQEDRRIRTHGRGASAYAHSDSASGAVPAPLKRQVRP